MRGWVADLTAEYVTKDHEAYIQVVARLELERPESPWQILNRRSHEAVAADYYRKRRFDGED